MNEKERSEILELASENVELQRLVNKHQDYKDKIRVIRKRGLLTSVEQQEVQSLKLKKLHGKEKMIRLAHTLRAQNRKSAKPRPIKTHTSFGTQQISA